jgi:clan AA aspartic protease (TIGR02281 family)
MAIRILSAVSMAAIIAVSAPAMAANFTVVKTWSDGPLPVYQIELPNGIQKCHFGESLPNNGDGFSISQFANGQIQIFLARKDGFSKGGQISLTVDGGVPFVAPATLQQPEGLLTVIIPNEGAGRDFLHDLWNGQTVYVAAGPMQAAFSLTGSAAAIAVLHRCAEAIATPVVATAPTPTQPAAPQAFTANPPALAGNEAALTPDGGSLLINAMVNGNNPIRFVLDSGSTGVSLPQPVADQLFRNGALSVADFKQTVDLQMADGQHHTKQLYLLHSVTVGGVTVHDVMATVGGNGDPLLGLSFLSRLSSWSIDNKRNMLVMGQPT